MEYSEIHQHFDGSMRAETIYELGTKYDLISDEFSLQSVKEMLLFSEDEEKSLDNYLDKFSLPMWYSQFYNTIKRVAYEAAIDAYAVGVRKLELRYAPHFHRNAGLTIRQTIRAVLDGLDKAEDEHEDLSCGLTIIAMRQHGPHIAKLLVREISGEIQRSRKGCGVVGFDIAGPEAGHPPKLFKEAYALARQFGFNLTAHVGEIGIVRYVWQAIDELGVDRLGHAVCSIDDKTLLRRIASDGMCIECCLTSNYQVGAISKIGDHPIEELLNAGCICTLCTDNPIISNTNIVNEYNLAKKQFNFSNKTINHLIMNGFRGSFVLDRGKRKNGI